MITDWCGVCGGDNSTCHEVKGSYKKTEFGYREVVRIPAGAANIDITQYAMDSNCCDDNYIVLKDPETNEYILNGHMVLTGYRKTIHYGGILLEYTGSEPFAEKVTSVMQLRKDLIVEVLTVGVERSPNVSSIER